MGAVLADGDPAFMEPGLEQALKRTATDKTAKVRRLCMVNSWEFELLRVARTPGGQGETSIKPCGRLCGTQAVCPCDTDQRLRVSPSRRRTLE
jgi:hypothetical protein